MMNSVAGRGPGMARKRSNSRMDASRAHDGWRYQSTTGHDRLPVWQVALLLAASVGMLYVALSWTNPRARAAKSMASHMPKCFPLDDKDAVRLLGAQNKVVNRPIATTSEWAQSLFNLGLLALHGFNQLDATKMFQACLRSDPSCAMCHWGLAYAQGPMPNKVPGKLGDPFPSFQATHATDAYNHMQAALKHNHAALGAMVDVALVRRDKLFIEALAERFKQGAGALKASKWREHEARYAQRMQEVAESEQDADAYALAAEAYMNLSPWDYYNQDGSLKPNAATAEQLLLKALALRPEHTHALHLHVHIAEAGSPVAEPGKEAVAAARALGSADTLAQLNSQNGHLMHMPSHIFVRTGRYKRAVVVNKAAYDFDLGRGQQCIVAYLPEHNINMLVYAGSMAGLYYTAEAFSTGMRNLRTRLPDTWMAKGKEWVSLPIIYIRYGEWDKLLRMSPPPKDARGVTSLGGPQFAAVVYHAGRLLAMAARAQAASQQVLGLEDVTAFDLARKSLDLREREVAKEHALLQASIRAIPSEPRTKPGSGLGMYASEYASLANIMSGLVEARLRLLRNNTAGAQEALREAVAAEDALGYMEPPRVHQPLRQCLGWVLLQSGRLDDAWRVYSQDLQHHPDNGWSLLGLKQIAQARSQGVADASEKFQQAWADAEVQIDSSCPALARPFIG